MCLCLHIIQNQKHFDEVLKYLGIKIIITYFINVILFIQVLQKVFHKLLAGFLNQNKPI